MNVTDRTDFAQHLAEQLAARLPESALVEIRYPSAEYAPTGVAVRVSQVIDGNEVSLQRLVSAVPSSGETVVQAAERHCALIVAGFVEQLIAG